MAPIPDRAFIAPGFQVSRMITGLRQIADMEAEGRKLDHDRLALTMTDYAEAGFDTFDMADQYGSAELIAGRCNQLFEQGVVEAERLIALTKWQPAPGPVTRENALRAVEQALARMETDAIDLMQLHWPFYQFPGWIDAMRELVQCRDEGLVRHIGVTNFDTDHLRLLFHHGFPVSTNQVGFSLLDRRAANDMTAFCLSTGIRLLAYGTLAGGLLSARWHGKRAPKPQDAGSRNAMRYMPLVEIAGGWDKLQALLDALAAVGQKHGVSIANVATRWVLEQRAVAAVIVGARLGHRDHREDNLHVFDFSLDDSDYRAIDEVLAGMSVTTGDCGDEYRKPDMAPAWSDDGAPPVPRVLAHQTIEGRPDQLRVNSGSVWEAMAGFSHAMRSGDRILVSSTRASHGAGEIIAPGSAQSQAVYIFDRIRASIEALGGSFDDIVRTRIYLRDRRAWEDVARVHGRMLGHVRPANTLLELHGLADGFEVEIEAEALVRQGLSP